MTEPARSPSRLGLSAAIVPRFERAGWIRDGVALPTAVPLLLEVRRGPEPAAALDRIAAVLEESPEVADRALTEERLGRALVAVCAASRELAKTVRTHPEWLVEAVQDGDTPDEWMVRLDSGPDLHDELRRLVRRGTLGIAVDDLLGAADMPEVGRRLASLADRAAAAAVDLAQRTAPDDLRFSVIAMGKWGGRELNYASDIDLLFVYEGGEASAARRVAEEFVNALTRVTGEGIAFRVDADLRPEGRAGPLARTLAAYEAYYERWAETWELQALIKARFAAGDEALGRRFQEMAQRLVYPETHDSGAVWAIRRMKRRAEEEAARRGLSEDEIKRGIGGIRDVEFAVQILQLVHGRADPALRSATTLEVLAALADGGYVRPEDAAALIESYPWLRDVEHRLQLYDLRQTHRLPADESGRERLARSMGYRDTPAATSLTAFEADLVRHRSLVRTIHERLFYRPLLEAFAESPSVHLSEEGLVRQFAALGFRDVAGAQRAFGDLTAGLSRRSRLMEQMLPLMLDWLSVSPDPDLGLGQLRMLVTSVPDNARLVGELRDNPVAAERLCRLLGTGRLLGRLVDQIPESLGFIGGSMARPADDRKAVEEEAMRAVVVRPDHQDRLAELRRFVRRHLLRVAVRDLLGDADAADVGVEMSDIADAATRAALTVARAAVAEDGHPGCADLPFAVIAMGKWGGRELNYSSDLDLLFCFRADPSAPDDGADCGHRLAERFQEALGGVTPEGSAFRVDADLRPEGRSGPLARSLDSYHAYYGRWAETWELQALLKARYVAGDPDVGADFLSMAAGHAYRDDFDEAAKRAVRAMKARIERERIPAGEDPEFHMKLGSGGLADVEFTAQLLQLEHGAEDPSVRLAGTVAALEALAAAGHLDPLEATILMDAYALCGRVRNRLYLQAGRPRDSLPMDADQADRLAISLGYDINPRSSLREAYRRHARRARRVVRRRFYGEDV